MTLKVERVFLFIDFMIDYSSIDQYFLDNLEQSSFKKIGLVMHIWTNDPSIINPPLEFKLSEPAFDFFERFGEGERIVRSIRKVIGHCRANDHDKIVLKDLLRTHMSSIILTQPSMAIQSWSASM